MNHKFYLRFFKSPAKRSGHLSSSTFSHFRFNVCLSSMLGRFFFLSLFLSFFFSCVFEKFTTLPKVEYNQKKNGEKFATQHERLVVERISLCRTTSASIEQRSTKKKKVEWTKFVNGRRMIKVTNIRSRKRRKNNKYYYYYLSELS